MSNRSSFDVEHFHDNHATYLEHGPSADLLAHRFNDLNTALTLPKASACEA